MMKRMTMLVSLVALVLVTGCASSRGRTALLDLDLRSADQIAAYEAEAKAVHGCEEDEKPGLGATTDSGVTWDIVFRLLEVVHGRIRILPVEWGDCHPKQAESIPGPGTGTGQ